MTQATISIVGAYRLGGKEKAALFSKLEAFVNLFGFRQDRDERQHDQTELRDEALKKLTEVLALEERELKAFRRQNPGFYPLAIRDARGRSIVWEFESRRVIYWFRDGLRRVWRGDEDADETLTYLLGLQPAKELKVERTEVRENHPIPYPFTPHKVRNAPGARFTIDSIGVQPIGRDDPSRVVTVDLASLRPSWSDGEFRYNYQTEFQRAVFLLFLESWRARICGICGRYFVADHARQRYCSISCGHRAGLARQKRWWKKRGKAWQAKRRKRRSPERKRQ